MIRNAGRRVAADQRKRTETSCDVCKSRKQKCDKRQDQARCHYCARHGLDCEVKQPRKKRLYGSLETLGTRIQLLEALAKGLLPEANVSSNEELRQVGASLGIPLPADDHRNDHSQDRLERTEQSSADDMLPLLPDQQGQVQYTGPASSFSFHLKLRSLFDNYSTYEFVLFGPNAAVPVTTDHHSETSPTIPSGRAQLESPQHRSTHGSPLPSPQALDASLSNDIISSFFEHVHPDFPVLHEPYFRARFESWQGDPTEDDKDSCWLVTLLCVNILGGKICDGNILLEQEGIWWHRIQAHLPAVLFTTNVAAIQALVLVALHLHHTNHRDACWNLTGTAIRIAHAIGLHSDEAKVQQTQLLREVRKNVWWSLLAFEQLQISSYDRPSAIDVAQCTVSLPNERVLGMGAFYPPDYLKYTTRLTQLLASACQARKTYSMTTSRRESLGPLSPILSVMRDLQQWKEILPGYLRYEMIDAMAPSHIRPVILLEVQYHYAIIVLTRSALLHHATTLKHDNVDQSADTIHSLPDLCRTSGNALCQSLLTLHKKRHFHAVSGFDLFYSITAALCLVLDLVCLTKEGKDTSRTLRTIEDTASLAKHYMRNPKLPGTLRKWATLITELSTMAKRHCDAQNSEIIREDNGIELIDMPQQQGPGMADARLLLSLQQSQDGLTLGPDNQSPIAGSYEQNAGMPGTLRRDWSSGLNIDSMLPEGMQDWGWDDIELLLNG